MNKLGSIALQLALLVSFYSSLKANTALSFPTGPAAYTIKVENSPNNKTITETLRVSNIEVVQDEQFRHCLITYSNNVTKEYWSIVGTDLFLTEYPNGFITINPTNKFFFVPYAPSSFDWVQPGLLQEKAPVQYQSKSCFHYKGPMSWSPSAGAPGMSTMTGGQPLTLTGETWVDTKTLLPVAFDDGKTLAVFTFHPTPTAPLVVPDKYLGLYQKYKIVHGLPKSQ